MYWNIFDLQNLYAFASLALDIQISLSHETFATTDTVAVAWSLSLKVYILKSDFPSMFHDTILDGMLGFGTLKSLDGTVMQTESDSKYRWYILQFDIITTNDF